MRKTKEEEAFDVLRQAGFTRSQINRFIQLRQDYATSELDRLPLDYTRLRFVRWLVATGRLTDQIPQEGASTKPDQGSLDHRPGD